MRNIEKNYLNLVCISRNPIGRPNAIYMRDILTSLVESSPLSDLKLLQNATLLLTW